jgi:hypothetical protein
MMKNFSGFIMNDFIDSFMLLHLFNENLMLFTDFLTIDERVFFSYLYSKRNKFFPRLHSIVYTCFPLKIRYKVAEQPLISQQY